MCSFPVCGAAVKLHLTVPRWAAEKPHERSSAPGPGRGGEVAPRTSHRSLRPLDPLPLFRQRQVCYDITPQVHVRSTIKRNSTSALRQTNSRFLFPISDKVSYVPRQSNCSYSDAVLPSSPSAWTFNSASSYKYLLDCPGT